MTIDYKMELGLDTKDLDKQYKAFYKKLEGFQTKVLGMYKKEARLIGMSNRARQSGLSIMQQQLRVQQKINALQGSASTRKARVASVGSATASSRVSQTKVSTTPGISDRARIGLADKIKTTSDTEIAGITDGTLDTRIKRARASARQLNRELSDAKSYKSLVRIKREFGAVQRSISGAVREQAKLNRKISQGSKVTKGFARSMLGLGAKIAGVYAVIGAGKEIFRVGKEFDAMQAGLLAASDGAKEAKDNFRFLMDTAKDLGTDVESGVRGFNRIGVAMKGAKFEASEIKEVFLAVQEASATFQLSADKSNLVMLAMSQMASKGKVSSEELSRQLAESLPIAMQAAERATGKTTNELLKMMKQGKLMSKDFLVPFAKAMRAIVRENGALQKATEKLTSQVHRLNTAYKETVNDAFQTGASNSLGNMFKSLTKFVEKHQEAFSTTIKVITEAIVVFVELGLVILDFIMTMFSAVTSVTTFNLAMKETDKGFDGFEVGKKKVNLLVIAMYMLIQAVDLMVLAWLSMQDVVGSGFGLLDPERGAATSSSNLEATMFGAEQEYLRERNREDTQRRLDAEAKSGTSKTVTIGSISMTSTNSDAKQTADELMARINTDIANALSF